jgi:3-oxoadipate enol-lactonase
MNQFTYSGGDGSPLYATAVGHAGVMARGISGPVLVLLHGGGPDHHSLVPLAEQLADLCTVVLPDIRGYGRSNCTDPSRHTRAWTGGIHRPWRSTSHACSEGAPRARDTLGRGPHTG